MVLTREYLEQVTRLEIENKKIRKKIEYYEKHPLQMEHSVVKGSRHQFPYTECQYVVSGAAKPQDEEKRKRVIRQLYIDLYGNEQILEDMRLDIELFLESLPVLDLEIKQILSMRYVDGLTDSEIAKEIKCERSSIGKKVYRFLKRYESAETQQ